MKQFGQRAEFDPLQIYWSPSRAGALDGCLRQYYYRYHLAPRARMKARDRRAVLVNELHRLIGPEAWIGQFVHQQIQQLLTAWKSGRDGFLLPVEQLVRQEVRRQYRASWSWFHQPDEWVGRPPALLEHDYYLGQDGIEAARLADRRSVEILNLLLASELGRRLRALPYDQYVEFEKFGEFEIAPGILAKVKPDFVYREGSRHIVIDWKTGRRSDALTQQAVAYRLYVSRIHEVDLEDVEMQVVHLGENIEGRPAGGMPSEVEQVLEQVEESWARIVELAAGETLEEPPPIDRFPARPREAFCRRCNFRAVCGAAAAVLPLWPSPTIRDADLEGIRDRADQVQTVEPADGEAASPHPSS